MAGIANTEKAQVANLQQAIDETGHQGSFIAGGFAISGEERLAESFHRGVEVRAEIGEIFHGGGGAGNQFMNLRTGFPALGNLVRGGTNFVRAKLSEVRALAVEYAKVGAEKFIRGANQEVAIEGTHVDRTVRAV